MGPFGCGKSRIAEWPTVVIVSVVVTILLWGVIDAGLNEQVDIAGSPLQEKLIASANEPCGVTVTLNVALCPSAIVWLVGVADRLKFAGFTVTDKAVEVLVTLLASPL